MSNVMYGILHIPSQEWVTWIGYGDIMLFPSFSDASFYINHMITIWNSFPKNTTSFYLEEEFDILSLSQINNASNIILK